MIYKQGKCPKCSAISRVSTASGKCSTCRAVLTLSDNWYVRYTVQGKTRVKSISPRKRDAEDFMASVRLAIRSGSIIPGDEHMITWQEAEKSFRAWFDLGHIKQSSRTAYHWCLVPLAQAFGDKTLQEITASSVIAYQSERLKVIAPSTLNREIGVLKRMYSLHCQWNASATSPRLHSVARDLSAISSIPENNLKTRFLTEEEASRLLSCCDHPATRMIIYVALMTGLRYSNVINLRWEQISDDCITIMSDEMKDSDTLTVPIHSNLKSALQSWRQTQRGNGKITPINCSGYVFPTRTGKPLTGADNWFRWAAKRAGLHDVSFHTLRHTFASNMLINGCSLAVVSELLGHNDISITKKRYGHLSHDHKRDEIERCAMGNKLSV